MDVVHRHRFRSLTAYPLAGVAAAGIDGFGYPAPGQSTGRGVLPVTGVEYLGRQEFGFSWVVNGPSVLAFGHTLIPDGEGGYDRSARPPRIRNTTLLGPRSWTHSNVGIH